jgi:polyhydroxyalkanoate synthesis regulator phasin
MKNLQKYFSGGEKGGWLDQMVSEGDLSKEGGEIFASLKGVDTASWNPEQQEAFVNKVVAQSGGTVSSDEAKKILKQSMSN